MAPSVSVIADAFLQNKFYSI